MSSLTFRIALIQMDIALGDPDTNYARAAEKIEEAVSAAEKPDVIVLPEMWNTGYSLGNIGQLADLNGNRTKQVIGELALRYGVHIIAGSVADTDGEHVRNTIYAFDRIGQMHASYSKIHLFRLMDEEKYLTAGEKRGDLHLEGQAAGMMICYDIRFPELARKLALSGAKILFVPAEWPHPRLHHWRSLLIARAIENQMYVCGINRVGRDAANVFCGHSMIVDPWGEVIAEADETEAIIAATVDLAKPDEVRGRIPVFKDRRPELY